MKQGNLFPKKRKKKEVNKVSIKEIREKRKLEETLQKPIMDSRKISIALERIVNNSGLNVSSYSPCNFSNIQLYWRYAFENEVNLTFSGNIQRCEIDFEGETRKEFYKVEIDSYGCSPFYSNIVEHAFASFKQFLQMIIIANQIPPPLNYEQEECISNEIIEEE